MDIYLSKCPIIDLHCQLVRSSFHFRRMIKILQVRRANLLHKQEDHYSL